MRPADRESHEEFAQLSELAPMGVLSEDERRRLDEHLRDGCEACLEESSRGAAALEILALAGPSAAPRDGSREALLRAVAPAHREREAGTRSDPRRPRWPVAWAAVAASVALLAATGSLFAVRRVERAAAVAVKSAEARIEAVVAERLGQRDARVDALASRLAEFESALRTVGDASVRAVTLAGDDSFGTARARVVVDPSGNQVLLLASRLPPAPPGHTYQLWVIVSGTPRSLGVFDADAEGRALHVESESLGLSGEDFTVAISVEPSGGVPQPTGPIVLVSH